MTRRCLVCLALLLLACPAAFARGGEETSDARLCGKGRVEVSAPPEACPCCGHAPVAVILYGLPNFSETLKKALADGTVVLGGCVVSRDDPEWRCANCGAVLYPARDFRRERGPRRQ